MERLLFCIVNQCVDPKSNQIKVAKSYKRLLIYTSYVANERRNILVIPGVNIGDVAILLITIDSAIFLDSDGENHLHI